MFGKSGQFDNSNKAASKVSVEHDAGDVFQEKSYERGARLYEDEGFANSTHFAQLHL
jgi:hypothetical protein